MKPPKPKPPDRTLNGFNFWFTRRRYGVNTTFTWVEYCKEGETTRISAGNPYQKINPSRTDLQALIDLYLNRELPVNFSAKFPVALCSDCPYCNGFTESEPDELICNGGEKPRVIEQAESIPKWCPMNLSPGDDDLGTEDDDREDGYFVDIPGQPGSQMVSIAQTQTFADASAIAKRYGTNALGWLNVLTGSGDDARPIVREDARRILVDCMTMLDGLNGYISLDAPDIADIINRSAEIRQHLLGLADRLQETPDEYQYGRCLEFALALYRHYVRINYDPEDICFLIAFGERRKNGTVYEAVNIHVVIQCGGQLLDSNGRHPDEYLQDRLDKWLEVEKMNGTESVAEILDFDELADFLSFLAHAGFDDPDQPAVDAAAHRLESEDYPLF